MYTHIFLEKFESSHIRVIAVVYFDFSSVAITSTSMYEFSFFSIIFDFQTSLELHKLLQITLWNSYFSDDATIV